MKKYRKSLEKIGLSLKIYKTLTSKEATMKEIPPRNTLKRWRKR
jgi:hypothetical protein